VWLDEKPARPKAEQPLIARQKRPGKREEKPHDRARRIANTQTVVRGSGGERVLDQKPAEAPFNAQRIVTDKTLNGRPLIPLGGPIVEKCRHVGQGRAEDWLYLECWRACLARARAHGRAHPFTPLAMFPRFGPRAFCSHMDTSQLR